MILFNYKRIDQNTILIVGRHLNMRLTKFKNTFLLKKLIGQFFYKQTMHNIQAIIYKLFEQININNYSNQIQERFLYSNKSINNPEYYSKLNPQKNSMAQKLALQNNSKSPQNQNININIKQISIPSLPVSQISPTLSTKNLFTHYFLIHDFLFRLVKNPSTSGQLFNLQIQINDSMRKAAKTGGKIGQFGTFAALVIYCFKSKSIPGKLLSGFLYVYWIDHFYTLGSYTGILFRMPSIYNKTADYFLNNSTQNQKKLFLRLNQQMKHNLDYEDTQEVLNKVFQQQTLQDKSYVVNDYFSKNKQKYFSQNNSGEQINKPNLKLKYLDCFLTRYVYYSFTRWSTKKLTSFGLMKNQF